MRFVFLFSVCLLSVLFLLPYCSRGHAPLLLSLGGWCLATYSFLVLPLLISANYKYPTRWLRNFFCSIPGNCCTYRWICFMCCVLSWFVLCCQKNYEYIEVIGFCLGCSVANQNCQMLISLICVENYVLLTYKQWFSLNFIS